MREGEENRGDWGEREVYHVAPLTKAPYIHRRPGRGHQPASPGLGPRIAPRGKKGVK